MTRRLSRRSKKSPDPPGDHRRRHRQAARTLVPRRSPRRPKEQDHAAVGRTRHAPFRLEGSAHSLGLYLRRHLSRARQGDRSRAAILQHRGDGIASPGDRTRRAARSPRGAVRGSSRLARHREAESARKHDAGSVAVQIARTQSRRKHLAVYARQLALEPDLQKLRRHRRSLLFQLEQARRTALAHYINRNARLGSWVRLLGTWYEHRSKSGKPKRHQINCWRRSGMVAQFVGFAVGVLAVAFFAATNFVN